MCDSIADVGAWSLVVVKNVLTMLTEGSKKADPSENWFQMSRFISLKDADWFKKYLQKILSELQAFARNSCCHLVFPLVSWMVSISCGAVTPEHAQKSFLLAL